MLLQLSKKLIPKGIRDRKSECVLEYIGNLALKNIVGEIWEDADKVSFADFWSSVDLAHL